MKPLDPGSTPHRHCPRRQLRKACSHGSEGRADEATPLGFLVGADLGHGVAGPAQARGQSLGTGLSPPGLMIRSPYFTLVCLLRKCIPLGCIRTSVNGIKSKMKVCKFNCWELKTLVITAASFFS